MLIRRSLVATVISASIAALASAQPGDNRKIKFTLPARDAFDRAVAENRLLFLKPIYGGVDQAGYADYRAGSW